MSEGSLSCINLTRHTRNNPLRQQFFHSQNNRPAKNHKLLVYPLTSLRDKGNLRPRMSMLEAELTPESIYGCAGVTGFKEYARYGEQMGVVRLEGSSITLRGG
jgi:hypothetical protein